MITLRNALNTWGSEEFDNLLRADIDRMSVDQLPLQQALTSSSYALDNNIKSIVINKSENSDAIRIKAGVYYTGIIAGCNCADDPSPADEIPEYCVVRIDIDKKTAEAKIILLNE